MGRKLNLQTGLEFEIQPTHQIWQFKPIYQMYCAFQRSFVMGIEELWPYLMAKLPRNGQFTRQIPSLFTSNHRSESLLTSQTCGQRDKLIGQTLTYEWLTSFSWLGMFNSWAQLNNLLVASGVPPVAQLVIQPSLVHRTPGGHGFKSTQHLHSQLSFLLSPVAWYTVQRHGEGSQVGWEVQK